MRPIKFRGRVINRKAAVGNEAEIGDIVKGSLIIYEDEPAHHRCWIKRQEKNHTHIDYPVAPDSVAQLVGYDANGREVYEDDVLIDQNGREYTISDVIQVELFCGGVYEPLYSTRYKFTLKEETP